MYRLSDEQREQLYRYWIVRGERDPVGLVRATRGGALRQWAPLTSRLLYGCETPALSRARYVFSGHKLRQLIEALPRDQVALVVGRPNQLRYARRTGLAAQSLFDARWAIARNLGQRRDPEALDRAFDHLVRALSGPSGRFLVLQTDANALNRLLLFAAHAADLRVVLIQHGIYQKNTGGKDIDGFYADYVLVYDSYQRSVLEAAGLAPERLPILGFPTQSVTQRLPPPEPGAGRKVCLLGQPWGNLRTEWGARYLEILRSTVGALDAAGVEVHFKPHPREKLGREVRRLAPVFRGSMSEALNRFEVCVSFTSTALLEATLAGRVAIQIEVPAFGADRLDAARYAHSLRVDEIAKIADYCREAAPIENPELVVLSPTEFAQRFEKLLASLDPIVPPHRHVPN